MADTKILSKKIGLVGLILLLLMLSGESKAERNGWINFTSFKDVRRLIVINDTLFAATSGGILAVTDFDRRGKEYNNQNGLGTNDITDIIQDADGQKWVTGFGRLIRFSEEESKQYLFFDNDDNLIRLYRVVDDDDNLWVGTNIGLVLFSKFIDDGQIQDSYQLFGDLNPSPAVYDILLTEDSIWLATSAGLAAASRTVPAQLKSPSTWTVFNASKYSTMVTDTVVNVVLYQEDIYAATKRALIRLEIDDITGDTSFVNIPLGTDLTVYQLSVENDSLIVYYSNSTTARIGAVDGDAVTSLPTTGLTSAPIAGVGCELGRCVGVLKGGVFNNSSGAFLEYPYSGLPGGDVTDITVNRRGVLTAGFRIVAMSRFEDSLWTNFVLGPAGIRQGTSLVMTDSSDNTWMGTIGNGLWFYDGDTLIQYDTANSSMRGNIDRLPSSKNFIIVLGLVTDGRYLYVGCYRALNIYPIAIADLDNINDLSRWDSIGVLNGLDEEYVVSIDLYGGQLAVGTETQGVYLCDVGNNPFDHEATCRHYTRENSLLISNSVRVVKYSPNGTLWVGTNFGLSRFDPDIGVAGRFIDVSLPSDISSDVTTLDFDRRGNLWVGTKNGLARFDATTGEFDVFNTLNSDIVSDIINKVTVDKFTCDVYVATNYGFSYMPSEIGVPAANVEDAIAFPNPFVIRSADDVLTFNFAEIGIVRIFNVAGELIRELSVNSAWNGKNDKGKDVASGVYVFVITDSTGNIGIGKFLLVRE